MTCKVEGCAGKHYGRGFCQSHYEWLYRRGFLSKPQVQVASTRRLTKRRSAG